MNLDERRLRERVREALLRIDRRLRRVMDDEDVKRVVADFEMQDRTVKR